MAYDIAQLEAIDDLDVQSAVKNFSSFQAFFNQLDTFIDESRLYLCEYNPSVVIYSDSERQLFLADTQRLKDDFNAFGMMELVKSLDYLDKAVADESVNTLSDGLLFFTSQVSVMAKKIVATHIVNEVKRDEKPIILAVDDKPELLTALVGMLSDKFTVMGVTSGAAALKAIEKRSPELFLLDIEMPVMDGYELSRAIRQKPQFEKTPIIFLTAQGTRKHVLNAIKHGVKEYIVKPVEKEFLLNKIERCMEKEVQ